MLAINDYGDDRERATEPSHLDTLSDEGETQTDRADQITNNRSGSSRSAKEQRFTATAHVRPRIRTGGRTSITRGLFHLVFRERHARA